MSRTAVLLFQTKSSLQSVTVRGRVKAIVNHSPTNGYRTVMLLNSYKINLSFYVYFYEILLLKREKTVMSYEVILFSFYIWNKVNADVQCSYLASQGSDSPHVKLITAGNGEG